MKTKQRKELLPGKKIAVDSNTFDAMTVEAKIRQLEAEFRQRSLESSKQLVLLRN